jgi:hypothetical protein
MSDTEELKKESTRISAFPDDDTEELKKESSRIFAFPDDARRTGEGKRGLLSTIMVYGKFEDKQKKECFDLGKLILNNQVTNEKIIDQVAKLASFNILFLRLKFNPEIGELVKAIASGNAQFVMDFVKKIQNNWIRFTCLSQISNIFLIMVSSDELNNPDNRKIIFEKFLELFGGYFLLGSVLIIGKDDGISVEKFENVGTRYDNTKTYPPDVNVHDKHFVFSTRGQNLEYDKFTPDEILQAIDFPFPEKLRLRGDLSKLAEKQILVVKTALEEDTKQKMLESEPSSDPTGLSVGGERRTKRHRSKSSHKRNNKKKHRDNKKKHRSIKKKHRSIKKKHRSNKRMSRRR